MSIGSTTLSGKLWISRGMTSTKRREARRTKEGRKASTQHSKAKTAVDETMGDNEGQDMVADRADLSGTDMPSQSSHHKILNQKENSEQYSKDQHHPETHYQAEEHGEPLYNSQQKCPPGERVNHPGSTKRYSIDHHRPEQYYEVDEYGRRLYNIEQRHPAGQRASQVVYQQAVYHTETEARMNRYRDQRDDAERRLEKAQKEISELQAAGLAAVDRYQPDTDEAIMQRLTLVEGKIKLLVARALSKQKSSLDADNWAVRLRDLMLGETKSLKENKFDVENNSILRKKVLRNIVWRFLCEQVFKRPLGCFGGEVGANASLVYEQLYEKPEQNEGSTKWRTMTVARLEELDIAQGHDLQDSLAKRFRLDILEPLGYKFEKKEEQNRLTSILVPAISLAQFFARQRAIFSFQNPPLEATETKEMDSPNMTNQDDEFDGPGELKGKVWFVVQPALVKFGTGKGEKLNESTIVKKAIVELVEETGN